VDIEKNFFQDGWHGNRQHDENDEYSFARFSYIFFTSYPLHINFLAVTRSLTPSSRQPQSQTNY